MDVNAFAVSLRDLASPVLLERFGALVQRDHRVTAALLCYIAEIDRRELWAEQGCSSMFKFCVERFHMSESMAGKRIYAARAMRRFPLVGQMVAKGELHLSAVCRLASHLTEDNHREVLARARHLSTREVERLVAEIRPRPDAPSTVRREPRSGRASSSRDHGAASTGSLLERPRESPSGSEVATPADAGGARSGNEGPGSRSRTEPLSPQRYRIGMTVTEVTHRKLGEAQALLSHQVPSGDVAIIFDRALDALLESARKSRTAATARPRPRPRNTGTRSKRRTRHVPAEVRRAVWTRDGGQCAYVGPGGHRCTETRWLELHHREPYALGGEHTVDGIELRCRPHNQYQANLDYGHAFMERKRGRSHVREPLARYRAQPRSSLMRRWSSGSSGKSSRASRRR